jgi:hypothetical protein
MNRTRVRGRCLDCNQVPKANASGSLTRACKDRRRQRIQGIQGTEEDERLLTRAVGRKHAHVGEALPTAQSVFILAPVPSLRGSPWTRSSTE